MSASDVQDFAERVKKFYFYRASLCEQLYSGRGSFSQPTLVLPPSTYDPFSSLYLEAFIIACAAIDGLAAIWLSIDMPDAKWGNQKRFTSFLERRNVHRDIHRVCTPFLYYFLKTQDIEQPFRDEVFRTWVFTEDENRGHPVYNDPTVDDLKSLYQRVSQNQIKDINQELIKFKYSALIYKYYRCSFIHEFRASRFVTSFAIGEELRVRNPMGMPPKLDIGLGILTKAIEIGADYLYPRIISKGWINIPYSADDEITIETKPPAQPKGCLAIFQNFIK